MALTKYNLGELIELVTEINSELKYGSDSVKGMTITKEIIPTKANVKDTDLRKFIVVHPNEFIFNPRTHGKKIGFGYNSSNETFLISWNNIAFRIKSEVKDLIIPEYLFLHFNRSEWDREACYRSWGSSTEVFSWNALCEMEIELPSIDIQQKYVDIYNSMVSNQKCYERGLEDLRVAFECYIDKMKKLSPHQLLGQYICISDNKNSELLYGIDDVKGVSIEKKFIPTKANMDGVSLSSYSIVQLEEFAYVTVTSRNGEKISLAYNNSQDDYICSSTYIVFSVTDKSTLLPSYLAMLLERSEFNRYARYNSWGSARETFDWEEMCNVKIPVPPIDVQKSIVNIYNSYIERKEINERLKARIKELCPILIKGSIEEARKTQEA